jgi:hypothetical protein
VCSSARRLSSTDKKCSLSFSVNDQEEDGDEEKEEEERDKKENVNIPNSVNNDSGVVI